MQIIYQGAESIVYLSEFDGQKVIVKDRVKKSYRIPQLDEELRKLRTRKEVKLLTDVRKLGISTPKLIHVDDINHKIIMEFIEGKRLKEHLNDCSEPEMKAVCQKIGKLLGKLHSNNIVHGDLTTSNMILSDDQIYFIDFSLGDFTERIEDKGVDLKLLKDALKSTHFKMFDEAWKNILIGYEEEYRNSNTVLEQLKEIEKRVRYANRE